MKVISQETFDEVVLENIRDFDNCLEDAIIDAVKEFEAQGVVFGNIVKNPRLNDDNTLLIHDILESLSIIQNRNEVPDEKIVESLKIFTQQCSLSIAHRVLACKHDGFQILLNFIKELKDNGNNDKLSLVLKSMAAVTDTNPDILTQEGVDLLIELLQIWSTRLDNEQVSLQLVCWSIECCLKHEDNRQTLVIEGAPDLLITLLQTNKNSRLVIKATCRALRCFALDDDIRVPFGKAHDHARLLVEEHSTIKICLQIVKGFTDDIEVTSEILSTLSRLCVRAEYCQQAVDNDALNVINDILMDFPDSAQLNKQSINFLKTISGNDKVKDEVMKIGAGQLIIMALIKHQTNSHVCEAACGAISMLALRVAAHSKELGKLGAADAVVQAMKIHANNKQVQIIGCMAVRNLAAKVPENLKEFVNCQVETVIQAALEKFGSDYSLKDIAKAALRDLQLDVKLEEQWRGTGIQMERGDD